MKSILSFVFCIVALTTSVMAQSRKTLPPPALPMVVTETNFMANPSSFNGVTFTIQNVTLRSGIVIKSGCKKTQFENKPITVEFASAPTWNSACFSIPATDYAKIGRTKADITLSGDSVSGFRITSYKKL
jgi:hypothetical protein